MSLLNRIKKGWNLFKSTDEKVDVETYGSYGSYSSRRPDRIRLRGTSTKSIMSSIINRIGVDYADVAIRHVVVDDAGRYLKDVDSSLNDCLKVEPNIDQSPVEFRRDVGMTMLEEGVVAIVPVDTDKDPEFTDGFRIETMRVGTIVSWFPNSVRVRLFREEHGRFEEVTIPKRQVAIVENPFYTIMNEPNSTAQRLSRKMALMDAVDEQIGAGKMDLIIQLPYMIKSESKKAQAEKRRSELEEQLQSSQYGVAYADGTERIVQLNRPVENNLIKNVEHLTKMLYDQLGITEDILNGTASEATMLNYQNRIIKPMLIATVESMRRKFLSKTARTRKHSIEFFQDRFSLVPAESLAELSDKLTRNAILSSNEFRQILGYAPSDDPLAEKLVNKNMPIPEENTGGPPVEDSVPPSDAEGPSESTEEVPADTSGITEEYDKLFEETISTLEEQVKTLLKQVEDEDGIE